MKVASQDKADILEGIDALIGIVLLIPLLLWNVFVVWKLYGWAAAAFHLPVVSYGVTGVVFCLVSLLSHARPEKASSEKTMSITRHMIFMFSRSAMALLCAYGFYVWWNA